MPARSVAAAITSGTTSGVDDPRTPASSYTTVPGLYAAVKSAAAAADGPARAAGTSSAATRATAPARRRAEEAVAGAGAG